MALPPARLPLIALLSVGACGLGGPCDQQRGIIVYAAPDGSDVRQASQEVTLSAVGFQEHRDFRREVHWVVISTPLRGRAMAVHLHEGSASADGRLLYDFPVDPARQWRTAELEQVTAGLELHSGEEAPGDWYRGTLPFDQLMRRLYLGPAYLDVHTDSVPAGEVRLPLGTPAIYPPPVDPAKWHSVYCS